MGRVYYITHPDVIVDPAVPVSAWPLSEAGLRAARALLRQPWLKQIGSVFSSPEGKAAQVAAMIAAQLALQVQFLVGLAEIDRSATGYLPPDQLAEVRARFFAQPHESASGWERLVDAQQRTLQAVEQAIQATAGESSLAIVGHRTVGTLLYCRLKGSLPDPNLAPPGLGFYFIFERQTRRVLQSWKAMDEVSLA
jgi:broad specificity phosphatase PhoE